MRGRKPKPSVIRALEGNPGKRPLSPDEPRPPATIPACPPDLPSEARKEWRRVARDLKPLRLLTRLDRAALAAYCTCYARWREAEINLAKTGIIVKSPSGYPIQNPYLAVANQSMSQMQKFLVELGMTPSARSRVRVAESPQDEMLAFLRDQGER